MTYIYVPIYKNNESPHLELTYSEEGVLYFYIFIFLYTLSLYVLL